MEAKRILLTHLTILPKRFKSYWIISPSKIHFFNYFISQSTIKSYHEARTKKIPTMCKRWGLPTLSQTKKISAMCFWWGLPSLSPTYITAANKGNFNVNLTMRDLSHKNTYKCQSGTSCPATIINWHGKMNFWWWNEKRKFWKFRVIIIFLITT